MSITGVTDADNVSATNLTGAITGPVSYFWQEEETPGSGVFTDIMFFQAGETGRAEGTTFTPVDGPSLIVAPQVGLRLRVRAVYKDANDVLAEIVRIRPHAWPNLRMVELGDAMMARDGELIAATVERYRDLLRQRPKLRGAMARLGRARELAAADAV